MKVLYVEDDPIDADLVRREFRSKASHFELDRVGTHSEAVAKLDACTASNPAWDVVLADVHLPDGTGLDLIMKIRELGLQIPVVVITGTGTEETAVAALKAGASDYVVKKGDFLARLPMILEKAQSRYRREIARFSQPIRVLYAEHNAGDIDMTRRHLARQAPYIRLDVVNTAEEVLQRFSFVPEKTQPSAREYDVILLDYRLPGMNALELFKELQDTRRPKLPVVFVTGLGDEEVATQAVRLGVTDYVVKNPGYLFQLPAVLENAHYRAEVIREHESLEKSEARFRQVVESWPIAVAICEPEGQIEYINPVFNDIFGYTIEEIPRVEDWFARAYPDPAYRESLLARWRTALEKAASKNRFVDSVEVQITCKDGSIRTAECFAAMMENRALVMFVDITERKRAEEEKERLETQLRQAQKLEAVGTLAGGIAHDFNNILAPIIGWAEMALTKLPKTDSMRLGQEQILTAALRAKDLVKQILVFGRPGRDQQERPVELSSIVKEALKLLSASLPSSIEISHRIEGGVANADPTQIHQILMNLCTNAAHAMGEKGILGVELSRVHLSENDLADQSIVDLKPGPHLNLRVSDTGIGMDKATLERIFDPFFTTKEIGKGSGLGLSVVKGIVKQHHGAITVQSAPGGGSTFSIYIPAIEVDATEEIETEKPLLKGTERILLVDDEQIVLNMATTVLEGLGYSITAEAESKRAYEVFGTGPAEFDLVITDYTMPELTGIDLALAIRRIRPDIPVIICTGFSEKMTDDRSDELGLELLLKPYSIKQLSDTVRKVLDLQKGR